MKKLDRKPPKPKPQCDHIWHLVGAQVIEIYRCSKCGEESFT